MFELLFESSVFYFALPLFVFAIYSWMFKSRYNLPPGPKSWPFIGSIPDPFTSPQTYKRLLEDWKDKYGDIILFKRLGMNFVYVNDYKVGYQAFAQTYSKELAGRPVNSLDRLSVGNQDVLFPSSFDASWVELRKYVMSMLRKAAEPSRMAEITNRSYDLFANHIREKKELVESDGFYVEPLSYWIGHNLLVEVFWQNAVEYNDADYQDSINVNDKLNETMGQLSFINITPLNVLPHPGKKQILKLSTHLSNKIQKHITERREDKSYKTDPSFFIDYCMEIQDNQKEESEKYGSLPTLTDCYICNLTLDIYFAGVDAFGIGFTWTIGILALNPGIQEKIRQELNKVGAEIGNPFNEKHMDKLHYLNAVISEVMRIHSLSTFTSFHRAQADVKIAEYDIPKDTIIALNIYAAHHDQRYWKNPEEFIPERFLNEEGKHQIPKEGFMPFGAGRRICIAERYTVKESHIIFTGRICRDFQIIWSSKNKTHNLGEYMEDTSFRHTAPFYVEFVPIELH